MMNKKQLKEFKNKLEKEKENLEKELKSFAKEDVKTKGDWDTNYPHFGSGDPDSEADEVEEYEKLLSVEYALELKLKDVNSALEKIKKGKYGKCEKCEKNISQDRLKAHPEARLCMKCKN